MYPRDQLLSEKRKFKIESGLNNTMRIKRNEVMMRLYSFIPSDMNFKTILMPKVILAKKNCQRKADPLEPFLS